MKRRRGGILGGSDITAIELGLVDFGRLARNAGTAADIAGGSTRITKVQLQGIRGATNEQLALTKRMHGAIDAGMKSGRITGGQPALDALATATEELRVARDVLRDPAIIGGAGRFVPLGLGAVADARSSATALKSASTALHQADELTTDLHGTYRIDPLTSRTVNRTGAPAELTAPAIGDYDDPVRQWLDFDPAAQQRLVGVHSRTVGKLTPTEFHGLEHVPRDGGPIIVTSTHPSYHDPAATLQGLHRAGGPSARAMAAPAVARMLGGIGREAGVFPSVVAGGERRVTSIEVARAMLEQRQSVLIFPEGDVMALRNGAAGEPQAGIAALATQTGAPVLPSAGYGHQGRVALGGERNSTPVVVFGKPISFHKVDPAEPRGSIRAQLDEVREVYAQTHDRLLQEAVELYRTSG